MVVLQDGHVVVEDSQVAAGRNKELLVDAGMVQVVGDGGHQGGQEVQRREVRPYGGLLTEHVHGLGDVTGVEGVVVRVGVVVAPLHQPEEGERVRRVHPEVREEACTAPEITDVRQLIIVYYYYETFPQVLF